MDNSQPLFQHPGNIPNVDLLAVKADELRAEIQSRQPAALANATGTVFTGGEFRFDFWDQPMRLTFPELRVFKVANNQEMPTFHQAMLLYYFATCDGTDPTGQWVSFADLPDGRTYNPAFQGYTGREIVKRFGLDLTNFKRASENISGAIAGQGDAAYRFVALPLVPLLVVYWLGDEDFPSNCQILFDASVSHCLPTDACAIIGSMLTRKLLSAVRD